MLQWLLEEAASRDDPDHCVVERLFLTNFAAIHTSANVGTSALILLSELA